MKKTILFAIMLIAANSMFGQEWRETSNGGLVVYPPTTNVGIGTGAPTERLHLVEGAIRLGRQTSLPGVFPLTWTAPAIKFGNGNNIQIGLLGSSFTSTTLMFQAPKFGFLTGNVGIGTSSPQYKLDVNGTIHANEIIVGTVSGADFVFAPTYSLLPLSELSAYIAANNHLPEIPSAAEMESNGVNVNELQILLLKKIEELTLYILQQDQRINELENQ